MKKIILCFIIMVTCILLIACTSDQSHESVTETSIDTDVTQTSDAESLDTIVEETEEITTIVEETTLEEIESTEPAAVELYQLVPENRSLMQCYVIKTINGKLIVIDGGIDGEGKDRDPYLPTALRAIAGVDEGEYFEVEAWFLSHAHKDHMYELSKMMAEYSLDSNYKINNIYFDFLGVWKYPYQRFQRDTPRFQTLENQNKCC